MVSSRLNGTNRFNWTGGIKISSRYDLPAMSRHFHGDLPRLNKSKIRFNWTGRAGGVKIPGVNIE